MFVFFNFCQRSLLFHLPLMVLSMSHTDVTVPLQQTVS